MAALSRFVEAQQGIYERALGELRAGNKTTHWIWYVFPQIAGLGSSQASQFYAIADRNEAAAYLAYAPLADRLTESTETMLRWVGKRSAEQILGPLDAMKFKSSMTLFEAAGGAAHFGLALDRFFGGNRDGETLSILATIDA